MIKKTTIMTGFFLLSAILFAEEPCVEFYKDPQFGGSYVKVFRDEAAFQEVGQEVQSIKIPRDWNIILFESKNFSGFSVTLKKDVEDLSDTVFARHTIGSFRVINMNEFWPDIPVDFQSGVVLFSEPGFQGDFDIVEGRVSHLNRRSIHLNQIQSIFIHPGYRAQLFSDSYYDGSSITLYQSEADFRQTPLGPEGPRSIIVATNSPQARSDRNREKEYEDDWEPRIGIGVDVHIDDLDDAVALAAGALIIHAIAKTIKNQNRKREELGVTFYSETGYGGRKETFHKNSRNLDRTWFGEDELCSIDIPPGYEITLYEDRGYRGYSITLNKSISNLKKTGFGLRRASSFRLRWVGR